MTVFRRLFIAAAMMSGAAGTLMGQDAAQGAAAGEAQIPAAAGPAAEHGAQPAVSPAVSLAPVADKQGVGVHALSPRGPAALAPPRRDHVSKPVALMIVGGAILIVGAIVGNTAGTVIMIGGAAVGIIGLYKFLL